MEKVRVRDLAKELGMETSKELLAFLDKIGFKNKSASSNIEGDLTERVRAHFRKQSAPPPPQQPTVVTKSDGTMERRSSRVVLRRGPATPPPQEPPVGEAETTPAESADALQSEAVEVPPTVETAAERPAAVPAPEVVEPEPVASEPVVRVVEKSPAQKAEEERKEKDKKWKKVKPHEKKVQKGVLKKHIIEEIVEEAAPEAPEVPEAPETPEALAKPEGEKPVAAPAIVRQFQPMRAQKRRGKPGREKKVPSTQPLSAHKRVFKIEEVITVGDLAHRMGVKASDVIKKLLEMGMPSTLNQLLDAETAGLLAQEYGFTVENVAPEIESMFDPETDPEEHLVPRPPVVTIMGHVDHGKTTLLDAVRSSNVTGSEAGGITQHIGAYEVEHAGRKLVILDTPGHEAFTAMRARGASVTDIVILVVSADDGVMPQTIEAIDHAKAAGVPIVVAVNKIDKPGAQPDRIRQQLSDHGLQPEEWGGTTLFANISAKKREGIDALIELVLLQADVLELKANPDKLSRGTVIESRIEKGRGVIATVLVQDGTLKVGDPIVIGSNYGRVRALSNSRGKRQDIAGPGTPVEIQGLNGLPEAGQKFAAIKDERTARQIALYRADKEREKAVVRPRMSLEDLHRRIEDGDLKELNIIIKADVQGSMEALKVSLEKLSGAKAKVNIIRNGVGGISESDVMLASASQAVIIGFNVRPETRAGEIAERDGVDVHLYSVIYDVVDDIRKAMEGLLSPTLKEVVQGRVEIRETFHISKVGTIAGCKVLSGKIMRTSNVRLLRDNVVVFDGKLASLKRFKDDAKEVLEGFECGLGIEGYNDLQVGDQIEAYTIEKVAGVL
ncbi:MAG TPA: translation initiation factor IF-2 [Candidatus Deferrimicrobiaceae bacterium]|jgi:translation initiation factor IF-2